MISFMISVVPPKMYRTQLGSGPGLWRTPACIRSRCS